ncbi:prepilin-type N-terminal cleavage/methylation domain-containing protein [Pseudoalteromonas sp. CO325X]|uniref:prepilin-type N-terminal cleavage/methylation domain-containing protein n=1 Tax=Pseudoalteromonas sp. CO325X TaxID=1777262 RepID=UPI0023EA5DB7|nr:prepilin-type N-terminal cleavage/methylation domain-containing protein [Pseudoalteromonas sp. CO325X]
MSHSKVKGFTLIELLIVLVLMGLALSIVLPNLQKQVDKIRFKGELQRLEHIGEYARYHTYFTNSPLVIKFNDKQILVTSEEQKDIVLRTFEFKSLTFPSKELRITPKENQPQTVSFTTPKGEQQEILL